MHRRLRGAQRSQSGQVLPLLVVMVLFIVLLAAFPLDGGLSHVLRQQTQNAADAAAEGAAAALADTCFNPDLTTVHGKTIRRIIKRLMDDNTLSSDETSLVGDPRYLGVDGKP